MILDRLISDEDAARSTTRTPTPIRAMKDFMEKEIRSYFGDGTGEDEETDHLDGLPDPNEEVIPDTFEDIDGDDEASDEEAIDVDKLPEPHSTIDSEKVIPNTYETTEYDISSSTDELQHSLLTVHNDALSDSDRETNFGPPIPRKHSRKFEVIVYTPLKTTLAGINKDEDVDELSQEPVVQFEEPPGDEEDSSVFSMTHYGSLDWDHSGDEFDKIQVTLKVTRRSSSVSPVARENILAWFDSSSVPQSFDTSDRATTSAKRPITVVRDSRGKFAKKDGISAETSIRAVKKRRQSESAIPDKKMLSVVRDAKGKFAPNFSKPSTSPKLPVDRKSMSLVRDVNGKFAPKDETLSTPTRDRVTISKAPAKSVERGPNGKFVKKDKTAIPVAKISTPISQKRKRSESGASERTTASIVRDAKGKFARKDAVAKSTAEEVFTSVHQSTPIDHAEEPSTRKETPIPPPPRINFNISVPQTKTPVIIKLFSDSKNEELLEKPKAKRRRAPAKSPYFKPSTPPVSPEKVDSTNVLKTEGETKIPQTPRKRSTSSQLETPQKDSNSSTTPTLSAKKRIPAKTVSCIPFPPLSSPTFGLIQEKLAHDPFRLLIAVTFLIRTHGKHAIPVFYALMSRYPTPESLIGANKDDIVSIIQHLGLQNQRAQTYKTYAEIWLENPPIKDKRYPVRGYPLPDSGKDIKKGEILLDSDTRSAWEIGHMTQGPYAIDSWRIFCRDKLRDVAENWNGEGAKYGFQPEWMRVVPEDKELRAFLRWMWLKEGFHWDPFTGEKEVAKRNLIEAAMEGRVVWDDAGGMRILDHAEEAGNGNVSGLSQIGNLEMEDDNDVDDDMNLDVE